MCRTGWRTFYLYVDEVSVLHEGEIKLTSDTDQLTSKALIEVMTGRELQRHSDNEPRVYTKLNWKLRISLLEIAHPVSLACHSGEILGVAAFVWVGSIGVAPRVLLCTRGKRRVLLHRF